MYDLDWIYYTMREVCKEYVRRICNGTAHKFHFLPGNDMKRFHCEIIYDAPECLCFRCNVCIQIFTESQSQIML